MDKIKKQYQIVVAKYNEDIQWLKMFKEITLVYNKGSVDNHLFCFQTVQLPNYGRESHTYLYHIIQNYDQLAEYTLFFQGSISDHDPLPLEHYFQENDFNGYLREYSTDLIKPQLKHYGKWQKEIKNKSMRRSSFTCYDWLKNFLIFDHTIKNIKTVWGALFSVSKKCIHQKPKVFYEHLLRFIDYHPNPEEGHFFERSWYFIFTHDYIKKETINVVETISINEFPLYKTNNQHIHYWLNLHLCLELLLQNNISHLICFPCYYFPIYQNTIDVKDKSSFVFKININDDLYFTMHINNNSCIIKQKETEIHSSLFENKDDFNTFKVDFNETYNKLIFNINHNTLLDVPIEIIELSKATYYFKTFDYNTLLRLNNNKKDVYIVKQNNYFDLKHYYTNHYLDYFIEYRGHT